MRVSKPAGAEACAELASADGVGARTAQHAAVPPGARNPPAAPAASDLQDDAALLEGIRRRDEQAFTQLVARYHTTLVRLARSFVRDETIAEEVAQETWLAVLNGIDGYEARGTLKAWIFRIVANQARTRAVRERRSINFSSCSDDDERTPDLDPSRFNEKGGWRRPPDAWIQRSSEEIALSSELGGRIRAAIDALPDRLRAIVLMRDIEGLSSEEVCNVLEIAETNQRVLLHRGRTRLRATLEAYLTAAGTASNADLP